MNRHLLRDEQAPRIAPAGVEPTPAIHHDLRRSRPARAAFAPAPLALAALALLLGLAAGAPADGADFYVDRASGSCSDSGPGTAASPYCTIGAALAAHHDPGTTLRVRPGVYREQVTLPASGVSGSPISIVADAPPGESVVIDGSDDFTNPSLWTQSSGDVWLASSVTWQPRQVFADGARLAPSTASPSALPPRSFTWVSGSGLYVNSGGGNPAGHGAMVGHRAYGVFASGKSWVTIQGLAIAHCEDRGVQLTGGASNVVLLGNTVRLSGRMGIQVSGGSANRVAGNRIFDSGDHGISLVNGATGCTIEDNESARNFLATARSANGLYLFGCPGNVIRRNRWHHNQDSGEQIQSGSNDNLSVGNLSWSNGDHGYDHLSATGTIHVNDVAYGNTNDGFSIEGNSTGTRLENSIAVDNGLATNEYDLWVDATSASGFASNDNLFWNSTAQPPVKFGSAVYAQVADYAAATGQDSRTVQADPRFADPANGDFHLLAGSPAIDNANSGVASWPAQDAEGHDRVDDPATPNTGLGPVTYADRGALEFRASSPPPPPPPTNQPPVARLTVTPNSGTAPLAVTADASASSDPDGRVTSYRFDFGDGVVVGPQAGPQASHTYAAGHWTVTVTVTDSAGATGQATATVDAAAPPPTSTNLVGNSSFETGASGWAATGGAAIQRASGGHTGAYSLLVSAPLLGLSPFGVTDSPNWVAATPSAGTRYQVSAWVRTDLPGGSVRLTVRETLGAQAATPVSSGVLTLSTGWQQLQLDYVCQWAGSTLDVQVSDSPALATASFRLDDVVILASPPAATAAVDAAGAALPGAAGMLPNPVRSRAQLSFDVAREGAVDVGIFDLSGRRVRRLLDAGFLPAGRHDLEFDGRGDDGARLAGGVYFYSVITPSGVFRGRFVVLR